MAKFHWEMTRDTFNEFARLVNEALEANKNNNTLLYEAAKEEIRCLPGFPNSAHPIHDLIEFSVMETSNRVVTFGSTIH